MTSIDPLALPFDQYQRYSVVAQVADLVRAHLGRSQLSILDVGGFYRTRRGAGISPVVYFLPGDRVVVTDLVAATLPGYVLSSGQSLPFASASFDLVVSCDTLEHILPGGRPAFVDELLRVARHCLVLTAPFYDESICLAERIVYEYLTSQGFENVQFREHIELGLPDAGLLRAQLAAQGLSYLDFADGYLHHWLAMMLVKHTPGLPLDFHLDLDRYYNRHFSPGDRCEPAYRRVFLVALPGDESLVEAAAVHFLPADSPRPGQGFDFVTDLIQVLKRGQAAVQAEGQLASLRTELTNLQAENESLRRLVAAYERGRFIRLMRWLDQRRPRFGHNHPAKETRS